MAAATFQDAYNTYLVIGVIDDATGSLTDTPYISASQGGAAHAILFQENGKTGILYTFNHMDQGSLYGEYGAVGLEGGRLLWSWPVQDSLTDGDSQLRSDYDAWCGEYLALMAPGGVDLFQRSQSAARRRGGSPVDSLYHGKLLSGSGAGSALGRLRRHPGLAGGIHPKGVQPLGDPRCVGGMADILHYPGGGEMERGRRYASTLWLPGPIVRKISISKLPSASITPTEPFQRS